MFTNQSSSPFRITFLFRLPLIILLGQGKMMYGRTKNITKNGAPVPINFFNFLNGNYEDTNSLSYNSWVTWRVKSVIVKLHL